MRRNCVQIITIFGAKGLEWECVAIPNLSTGEFPPTRGRSNWVKTASELPANLRGDSEISLSNGEVLAGMPIFDSDNCESRKDFMGSLKEHINGLKGMELEEKLRLMYVGVTRTERSLLLTGHGWSFHDKSFHAPSDYLSYAYKWAEGRAIDHGIPADTFPLLAEVNQAQANQSETDSSSEVAPCTVTTEKGDKITIHPYWTADPDPAYHPLADKNADAVWPVAVSYTHLRAHET